MHFVSGSCLLWEIKTITVILGKQPDATFFLDWWRNTTSRLKRKVEASDARRDCCALLSGAVRPFCNALTRPVWAARVGTGAGGRQSLRLSPLQPPRWAQQGVSRGYKISIWILFLWTVWRPLDSASTGKKSIVIEMKCSFCFFSFFLFFNLFSSLATARLHLLQQKSLPCCPPLVSIVCSLFLSLYQETAQGTQGK